MGKEVRTLHPLRTAEKRGPSSPPQLRSQGSEQPSGVAYPRQFRSITSSPAPRRLASPEGAADLLRRRSANDLDGVRRPAGYHAAAASSAGGKQHTPYRHSTHGGASDLPPQRAAAGRRDPSQREGSGAGVQGAHPLPVFPGATTRTVPGFRSHVSDDHTGPENWRGVERPAGVRAPAPPSRWWGNTYRTTYSTPRLLPSKAHSPTGITTVFPTLMLLQRPRGRGPSTAE
jgi:hypothetical protein